MRTKVKRLVTRLPATPCTEDMRSAFVELAVQRGVALADVQREAFSFFLSCSGNSITNRDTYQPKPTVPHHQKGKN